MKVVTNIGLDCGLAPARQDIVWAKHGLVYWRIHICVFRPPWVNFSQHVLHTNTEFHHWHGEVWKLICPLLCLRLKRTCKLNTHSMPCSGYTSWNWGMIICNNYADLIVILVVLQETYCATYMLHYRHFANYARMAARWFCRLFRVILCHGMFINPLWPSDATWRHGSRSKLAQVMACCLTAPSHYLNQCWLIISEIHWHSYEGNFTRDTSAISH